MSYDYTQEDSIPQESPDAYTLAGVAAGDQSVEEIEAENQFLEMPPGDHIVYISKVAKIEPGFFKVFVNGQLTSFNADTISLILAQTDNPKATIYDRFVMPPGSPAEAAAYWKGVAEDGKSPGTPGKMSPGTAGKRFMQLINRLGFPWLPGQPLPAEARKVSNWLNRPVGVTVSPGRGTFTDRSGAERPRSNQVKWFSYTTAADMEAKLKAAGKPVQAHRPLPGQQNPPLATAATAMANAGLDDV